MQDTKVRFDLPGNELMPELLGHGDELLQIIETSFPETKIHVRGNQITIDGESAVLVEQIFREMTRMLERGLALDTSILKKTIEMVKEDENPSEILTTELLITARGKPVRAKSSGQKNYLDTASKNIITFAVGPAGTGKSWLAVALAVSAMQRGEVDRIILTRPLVEAGERVGFLPGDLMAKVDPYFRPLYDALFDMLDPEKAERLLERGQIEVAPLAFMRGRTLNNSFIILDEAQNTTPEQMKMILTRIGIGSRVIVTGDASQVDVPGGRSGIEGLENIFSGIDGLGFVKLGARDVVRHKIVQDIVQAYENAGRQFKKNSGNK